MRKFLISIAVILVVLLLGQLIYYNYRDNKNKNIEINNVQNNISTNNEVTKSFQGQETTKEIQNVIVPKNIEELSQNYKGNVKMLNLEKEIYTFVNINKKAIYSDTNKKSLNQIMQMYDLNTEKINSYYIYSREDFFDIATQIISIGTAKTFLSSEIDMSTYNEKDSYASFNLKLTFTDSKQINMKVYLLTDNSNVPSIKFGKV